MNHPSFFMKGSMFVAKWFSSAYLLFIDFGDSNSLPSFHLLSIPLGQCWKYFCCCNSLKTLWVFSVYMGIHSIKQEAFSQVFLRLFHLYFWLLLSCQRKSMSHTSNLLKESYVWLNTVTCCSFWGTNKRLSNQTLGFSSKHTFLTVNLLTVAFFFFFLQST